MFVVVVELIVIIIIIIVGSPRFPISCLLFSVSETVIVFITFRFTSQNHQPAKGVFVGVLVFLCSPPPGGVCPASVEQFHKTMSLEQRCS